MNLLFSKLSGTLAVILLVSAFIGGSDIINKLTEKGKKWQYSIVSGLLGGIFGIYGNFSGFNLNGAVVSVRDIGPMLAGFIGGPIGGVIAGLIAGIHRLTLGGITAQACVVATCSIGLFCGLISLKWHSQLRKPYIALLVSALMEIFHLCIVLIMVKPFDTALDIVKQIALPFVSINAIGFALMVTIISYTEKQRSLVIEKSRMQSELEVATVIQHSLLPTINEDYPHRNEVDVSAYIKAAKEVGGDFYDVFFVDGNRIAFVIGDVSGKGVPAALFMANAKITLQNCIRDIPDLSEAIEIANNILCTGNEAEMFITLWVGVLDLTNGNLNFVSAGHNPPIFVKNGVPEYVKTKSGFVLAGMEGMIYKANSTTLEKGNLVYIYTDGVTEADNESEELFGEDRLLECFQNTDEASAEDIIIRINNAVNDFVRDNNQFDDMTMLCFRYLGTDNKITLEAKPENVAKAVEFVSQKTAVMPFSQKDKYQIEISVDEIVCNIASYAYPDSKGNVTVCVDSDSSGLTITVTDSGIPYNPLEKEDPDITLSAEERGIGGYGIFIVKKVMDEVLYNHSDGQNILTLKKRFNK